MVFVHAAVGEDQDICALPDDPVHLYEQIINRLLKPGILVVHDRDLCRLESFPLHILNLQKICIREDRIIHLEHPAVLFPLLQKIPV